MIQDLLGRYVWEIDHGTPEGWAAVFAEDGVFEAPDLKLRVEGTEALATFARDLHRTLPNVHHVMSNFVIDVSGNQARGRCELNEFMAQPEAVYANLQGWYEDDYIFDGERWRIQHAAFSSLSLDRQHPVGSGSTFRCSSRHVQSTSRDDLVGAPPDKWLQPTPNSAARSCIPSLRSARLNRGVRPHHRQRHST